MPSPANALVPAAVFFSIGAGLDVTMGGLIIHGGFSDGFYETKYVTASPDGSGALTTLDESEQKLNVDLTFGYEIVHHMSADVAKRFTLTPFVGLGARLFINANAPSNVLGPQVGANAAVALTDSLVLGMGYGFTPNLLKYTGVPLVFGTPAFDHSVDVDLSLRLFGPARARLAYVSEFVTLTSAYRSYQALGLGFDYGF